jgi:hypothetical protein
MTEHGQIYADAIQAHDTRVATLRSKWNGGDTPHAFPCIADIEDFLSLHDLDNLSPPSASLADLEPSIVSEYLSLAAFPDPLKVPKAFDPDKPPENLHEMKSRPDTEIWRAAMQREYDSIQERGVFVPVQLPPGRKAIGVRWTYDHKYHPDGSIIRGKEKARLVAQGFSQ